MGEISFATPVDICNRGLDHTGTQPIVTLTDDTKAARVMRQMYDKVRGAELRRNVWRFSIRKAALRAFNWDTMFVVFAPYNAAKTYIQGSVVLNAVDSKVYLASQNVPLATVPGAPNEAYWTLFYGPMTAEPWLPAAPATNSNGQSLTGGYYAGEFVYVLNGTKATVYMSLETSNVDNPAIVPTWLATQTYFMQEAVTYNTVDYYSAIDLNLANTPVPAWAIGTTYAASAEVLGSDNNLYTSVGSANIGHNPVGDAGVHWTLVGSAQWIPAAGTQTDLMVGQNWIQLDATVVHKRILYPVGSGPRDQSATRNLFPLPAGYLKVAPQDPKAGASSYLGFPSNLMDTDWEFEGNWIVTRDSTVIVLRFVADIADVTQMDPMFCEGLGARLGMESCETLTQSTEKFQAIGAHYKLVMGEARTVNGIEIGADEPPLDDYLACRI